MSALEPLKVLKRGVATVWRERPRQNFVHGIRRRISGDPGLPDAPIQSVLVLCHGNLFRSPFAESLLASKVPELRVSSAGLHAAQDHASPDRAIALAAHFGVDLKAHRTTPIGEQIVADADLILVMEGAQKVELLRLFPSARAKTRVLGDFLDSSPRHLPDPWSEDENVGRIILGRVEDAVASLAKRMGEGE